jgi:Zn-dependent peptidase ImmA (M78 family)
MRKDAQDRLVDSLLQKYSVSQPPVPIEVIATGEGAAIARNHFDGPQSGFALRSASGDRVIGVNTSTSPRRQRFTIAHELGHLLMHEGDLILDYSMRTHYRDDDGVRVNFRDHESSLATNSEEIEANRFAAEILMPRHFVFDQARKLLQDNEISRDSLIKKLAEIFNVSPEAMGYRLVNLTILVP